MTPAASSRFPGGLSITFRGEHPMKNARLLARKAAVYTLTVLLALGSFAGFANAQIVTTGRISGTVMDPQGAIVPTAEVVIKNEETGNEYKVKVGDDGTF